MNHVIEINNKHYVIRQQNQKILLFTFPELVPIQKHYASVMFSYLNPDTNQLLLINQNQINIMRPALTPLQFVCVQQSFIDWEPRGGILLRGTIVLYGNHAIAFYSRQNLMQKRWEIDIVQEIEQIKGNRGDSFIAMQVKSPSNTLFLWNTADISTRPAQEIILTQPIVQWEFAKSQLLVVLTENQLRIYHFDQNTVQYNLFHFYQLAFRTFAWIKSSTSTTTKQSVSTLVLLQKRGMATILELIGVQKRTQQSQQRSLGIVRLHYKDINMKRIIAAWGEDNHLALVCQTKNKHLFCFQLGSDMKIERFYTNEELLGTQINEVSCHDDLILARDRTLWKFYRLRDNNSFDFIDRIDCEKIFIGDKDTLICIDKQCIFNRRSGIQTEGIPFKYADVEKIHYLGHQNNEFYLVVGIRFYKWTGLTISAVGFSIRNQKAILQEVNQHANTLLYRVGQQYLLLQYRIANQKVTASSLKSSPNYCIGLKGSKWLEQTESQLKVGLAERVLCVFPLTKLYKMLDCEDKRFSYSIYSIFGDGLAIIIKNYVFYIQLIDDQKGCELVLLKRLNSLLYKRFSSHSLPIKLIEPNTLTFWVGNTVYRLGGRINPHIVADPYSLPQTLLSKQLDMRKVYPIHHPRLLLALVQSNRFVLLFQILHKIYDWFKTGQSLSELYKQLNQQFLGGCTWGQSDDNISLYSDSKLNDEIIFLTTFSNQLLENMERLQLKQKNPLYFQAIITSIANVLRNSKSIDYFSQSTIILLHTPLHIKRLNSMQIVMLSHSLNKQQALSDLKQNVKLTWQWIKDQSLPLWYDNKQELRVMIEEVAANEYRSKKDPFDCLFWYLLVGKKSLISSLFKNHRMDSKQHEAITTFLLRDFSQAKDRTAAIKNAYVLIDKKRYFHAMAFFILGNSIDDCIRLCIDRQKDINLAYTFLLFFKDAPNGYFLQQMGKGDAWLRHLALKQSGKHILSYNTLFEVKQMSNWNYTPDLAGFHPNLLEFSVKIKNSIGVKRQLDEQKQTSSVSQDIFSDFYGQQSKQVKIETQQILLRGQAEQLKQECIRFYLKQGLPILSLMLNNTHKQSLQAFNFEKYKLSGEIDKSMQEIINNLDDKVGLVSCYLIKHKVEELLMYLKNLTISFEVIFKGIKLNQVVKTKKHTLGDLLHYGYFSEQVLNLLKKRAQLWGDKTDEVQLHIKHIGQLVSLSKIFAALVLCNYENLAELLQDILKNQSSPEQSLQFWQKIKQSYDNLSQNKKQKFLKQMDYFEHAFISVKRKGQDEPKHRFDLELTRQQATLLQFRILVLHYLCQKELLMKDQIINSKMVVEGYLKNWISQGALSDIYLQFKTLIKEGSQSKLKLNLLKTVFDQDFIHIYDTVAIAHRGYFQQLYISHEDGPKELQGIEIFKNRQDGLRNFIINKHDSKGLQCIVMFKKGFKKFEICENLAKRQRSKDHFFLAGQDNFNTNISATDPITYTKMHQPLVIHETLIHIFQKKQEMANGFFPKKQTPFNEKEYIRHVQPVYLDYNELHSIQCHPFLPFILIGGKGNIQISHMATLKNFDRIKCPSMSQIIKLHSCNQRVGAVDSLGNLGIYHFDPKFTNPCVYSIKKAGILDFCYINPSVIATISPSAVQIYDTLLHPKKQLKFKQPFTKQPVSILPISDNRIAVLRKNDLLTYDIRSQRLQSSRQLKGKGKSLLVSGTSIYVGQNDCRVRIFSTSNQENDVIKLGNMDDKDRQKISVQQLACFGDIILAMTSDGSIFYLPKLV